MATSTPTLERVLVSPPRDGMELCNGCYFCRLIDGNTRCKCLKKDYDLECMDNNHETGRTVYYVFRRAKEVRS